MKKNFKMKELRVNSGYVTQRELAAAANVGRLTILDMENGRGMFNPTVLLKVSKALKVSVEKLFAVLKYDKVKYSETFSTFATSKSLTLNKNDNTTKR
mgnify:CR=1 FL=1|jgi:DNA-binding XRE family transcriptional regulator